MAGFEPTISVSERQQTYALDRAANGTGSVNTKYLLQGGGKSNRNNEKHCTGATFLHVSLFRGNYTLLFVHVFTLNMELRCSSETLLFANR